MLAKILSTSNERLSFGFQGELGYLDAYGDTKEVPFFKTSMLVVRGH